MDAAPLEVTNVHKKYQKKKVLMDISLSLEPGEIFGLIGLNGAGKTTLIKTVLDLVKAESGKAMVFGVPSTQIAARKHLSYLPEKFQPSRFLKGYEYLDLALSYYGLKLDKAEARQYAQDLDLDPAVLGSRVGSYSKGMGQKLGLAGAFMIAAKLYILDEPMSGLDPQARIKLKNMLSRVRQTGSTIFFSSHILSDIDEICDRIGVIHGGKLFYVGKPSEFKEQYGDTGLEKAFLNAIAA